MKFTNKLPALFLALTGILLLYLVVNNRPAYSQFQTGMPVRCEITITSAAVSQNVPMNCESPDGTTYENVPDGLYLYVTDIIVRPRLGGQTSVVASVRIWEENGFSATGCSGGAIAGSFVTDQYIVVADTSNSHSVHRTYGTPYLVLTPNDCLAVYTFSTSGVIVETSGYFWTTLGVPISSNYLPAVVSGN